MNPNYSLVAARAEHRCEYCHAPEAIFNLPFEVDHIIPTSREGANSADNWALACRSCNLRKSNIVEATDPVTQKRVMLFHPRNQLWDEHFEVDVAWASLRGKTATGRATVEQLRMNGPLQRKARKQWIRLGLFP